MEEGMESTKVMEANYPENLRRVFVINGNFTFKLVRGLNLICISFKNQTSTEMVHDDLQRHQASDASADRGQVPSFWVIFVTFRLDEKWLTVAPFCFVQVTT
jgi:hypothetical protein